MEHVQGQIKWKVDPPQSDPKGWARTLKFVPIRWTSNDGEICLNLYIFTKLHFDERKVCAKNGFPWARNAILQRSEVLVTCQEIMKVTKSWKMIPCTKRQEYHKSHNTQWGWTSEVQHKLQVAQKGAKKINGIRTHPRTKEPWWKICQGMLTRSGVSTTRSWGILPRIMKR